jgi:hypothetical protein
MSESLLIAMLSSVILLLLLLLLLQRKRLLGLKVQITQLQKEALREEKAHAGFVEELLVAERQLTAPKVAVAQEMPDRYRYVRAMARQGMNAAQIAKILQVGEEEAAQIVRLARLKTDL